ncbi:DUF4436 family protein [Streptomyces luteolus]|uniref:DUF4436 family protein n=1 Tax=Streptomyces luteolus TaxID=3043615 RepID=A0ABT6T0V5_9ACTN|nr:DUF4436 family protein [Streptomyces sp. B-S-A12]MDI3421473.1 DUF4436 family protein [Streptomyces sp. B-S-A12]
MSPPARRRPVRSARALLPAAARAGRRTAELPWRGALIGLVVLLALFGTGVGLYFDERSVRQRPVHVGAHREDDRLDVEVTVQRTSPGDRRMTLQLFARARGKYADPVGSPNTNVAIYTNDPDHDELRFDKDSPVWRREFQLTLSAGTPSDYPFDRYETHLALTATTTGKDAVPIALTYRDEDPNFAIDPGGTSYDDAVASIDGTVKRSRSTFIMAWFMIAAMWAIALAVAVACWLVVGQRRGLVWPALGWMAASLFALVGLRNAAPGSPPNGCVLDYAAFYWAEALIALSLTRLVFHGIHLEHRTGGPVDPLQSGNGSGSRGPTRLRRRGTPAGSRVRGGGRRTGEDGA